MTHGGCASRAIPVIQLLAMLHATGAGVGTGFTWNSAGADVMLPAVAVTVSSPGAIPVTVPMVSTVAIAGVRERHVTGTVSRVPLESRTNAESRFWPPTNRVAE